METHRLKSKFMERDREYLVQTSNDVNEGAIYSEVYVNGQLAEKAVQSHPEVIKPEEVLSLLKYTHSEKKKELETLLEAYRQALADNNTAVLTQLGIAFFYKRIFSEAQKLLSTAISLNPNEHQAIHYLSMTELALGNVEKAVEAGSRAVKMQPGYADYRCNLGEVLLASGKCKEAIAEFEDAIRLNLYYGDAYLNLGITLLSEFAEKADTSSAANIITRANDCLKKASLIYPEFNTSKFNNAMKILHEGDLKQTLMLLKEVREDKKEKHRREFAGFYMKFVLYPEWVSTQVIDERVRYLEEQIKKNPTYVDLYAELSRCYLEQSRILWKRGIEQYRKTLEISPSLTSASACLGKAEAEYANMCSTLDKIALKG